MHVLSIIEINNLSKSVLYPVQILHWYNWLCMRSLFQNQDPFKPYILYRWPCNSPDNVWMFWFLTSIFSKHCTKYVLFFRNHDYVWFLFLIKICSTSLPCSFRWLENEKQNYVENNIFEASDITNPVSSTDYVFNRQAIYEIYMLKQTPLKML